MKIGGRLKVRLVQLNISGDKGKPSLVEVPLYLFHVMKSIGNLKGVGF